MSQYKSIMRKIIFPLSLLAFSCCSTKKEAQNLEKQTAIETEYSCPDNVNCKHEILEGKGILVKTDGIGKVYYELEENPDKSVFRYTYDVIVKDPNLQDAGYREEILFEMDKNQKDFSISGEQLQNHKVLFGVFCFCRHAGSYEVKEGSVIKKGNTILISIPKIVVNQKLSEVKIKL